MNLNKNLFHTRIHRNPGKAINYLMFNPYMKTKILNTCWIAAFLQLSVINSHGQTVVFLHTDRSQYLAGESVFFKAWISDDLALLQNSFSSTFYVAIIDQEKQEVASGIFPVVNDQTEGNIRLSQHLTEGNYVLVACTNTLKSAAPEKMSYKNIKVIRSKVPGLRAELTLTDTLYTPGSILNANIRFSGESDTPIAAPFTWQLTGRNAGIAAGKGKAKEDGKAILSISLPEFQNEENLKLLVSSSYKGKNVITGIVIPTPDNYIKVKYYPDNSKLYMIVSQFENVDSFMNLAVRKLLFLNKQKQLNIRIITDKPQYSPKEKVILDIQVTDSKGNPAVASLSLSASNPISHSLLFQNDNLGIYTELKKDQSGFISLTPQLMLSNEFFTGESLDYLFKSKYFNCFLPDEIKSGIKEENSQINNTKGAVKSGDRSVFDIRVREFFAQYISGIEQSPGNSFIVQDKNDLKKIMKKNVSIHEMKSNGYSSDRDIFEILMQIKPYRLVDSKIIFGSSGLTSIKYQDGALIVIDGLMMGTDAEILKNIPVQDIAKIHASTEPSDIQRYTALNNIGIIEIFTKKSLNAIKNEKPVKEDKSNTVFWMPDIRTDGSGKASISFFNNTITSPVIISVDGITADGLTGSSTIQYFVK
jgi:hypothetical protein